MISKRLFPFVAVAAGLFCAMLFESCGNIPLISQKGNKYQYEYIMTSPVTDPNMVYRDSTIYIQFKFDDAALRFQLQNVASERLELYWSKATMGVEGKYYSIRNSKTLYSSSVATAAATVLPPLGYFTDFVIPEKNISADGSYKETDLLPTTDGNSSEMRQKILSNTDKVITFILPVKVGEVSKEYTFRFNVVNVDQIAWEKARMPKRPPKPIKTQEIHNSDQYIAAGIVIAIVGVASVLLTQKKASPSE
jgi:hypothetical protein